MFTERVQSEQEPRNELNADVWARAQPQVTGKGWQVPGALQFGFSEENTLL